MRVLLVAFLLVSVSGCKKDRRAAAADAAPKMIERPARKGRALPPLPDPLPGARKAAPGIEDAVRGAAGDLDGDGEPELVVAGARELRVLSRSGTVIASAPSPGGPQVLLVHDGMIVSGWGASREHKDAQARVSRWRLEGGKLVEEVMMTPATARHDILAILPADPGYLVAYFETKYHVQSGTIERDPSGKWIPRQLAKLRMSTSWDRGDVDGDGAIENIVGRVYGDDKEADGDAFVLESDGSRLAIPTTRGVRSVMFLDGEIWLGDGWHRDYGKIARGLLSVSRRGADGWDTEVIEDTEGQSALYKLLAADVDGDEDAEIVGVGSDYVRVWKREDRWRGLTVAGKAADVIVVDVDGDGADELITLPDPLPSGTPPAGREIISLKDQRWP